MKRSKNLVTRGARIAVAAALALSGLALAAQGPAAADWSPETPPTPGRPSPSPPTPCPPPQINGVVWSQAMAGNTVYAGGNFTEARPAGTAAGRGAVGRDNLLAYDVTTGVITAFAPLLNGQVRSVAARPTGTVSTSAASSRTVDGEPRNRLAAFDLATGELVAGFAPSVNGTVQAVTISDGDVYVGGAFGGVGNQARGNLAAFKPDGALLDWNASVGGGAVNAITANPDGSSIAVGGMFTVVNGDPGVDDREGVDPGDGLALFDATTGAALPLPAGDHIYVGNGEDDADGAITTLAADENAFYGAGYTFSTIEAGTIEGVFAVNWDGTIRWVADCHGDVYSVHPQGDVVYTANHTHYCENIGGVTQGAGGVGDYPYYRAVAFGKQVTGKVAWEPDNRRYYNFEGQPAPSQLTWYPSINAGEFTGQSQGPWSVTGNDDYIVMGGEFTRVNGQNQQGLVRFAAADLVAEKAEGPTLFNAGLPDPGRLHRSPGRCGSAGSPTRTSTTSTSSTASPAAPPDRTPRPRPQPEGQRRLLEPARHDLHGHRPRGQPTSTACRPGTRVG